MIVDEISFLLDQKHRMDARSFVLVTVVLTFHLCSCTYQLNTRLPLIARGQLDPKCIHEIPYGSTVHVDDENENLIVSTKEGERLIFKKCKLDSFQGIMESAETVSAYAIDDATSITGFNGTWKVPASPLLNETQAILIGINIEDKNDLSNYRHTLQFGESSAGGGDYWAIATWVFNELTGLHTPLQALQENDTIKAYMQSNSSGWTLGYSVNNGDSNVISAPTLPQTTAATTTFSANKLQSCGDLPSSGTVTFSDLVLYLKGKKVTPSWQGVTPYNACSEKIAVSSTTIQVTWKNAS